MRKCMLMCCGVLLMATACERPPEPVPPLTPEQRADFRAYAAKIEEALGVFHDITVFEENASGGWHLVAGEYIPVTVDGSTPTGAVRQSDRPMMLPTQVVREDPASGQSNPFSVVGRMPGSNPEVQWVFLVRQYDMKDTADADFAHSPDMAVIGHHPRTGATAYLQFYDSERPKDARVVRAPWSEEGPDFWAPMDTLVDSFRCQRCHTAGPFIHTPWINQVTTGGGTGGAPVEPMVPSDPLGPFFFVDSEEGERFWTWDSALVADKGGGHLAKRDNLCTNCHRVAPDLIGLNQNSTRYYGMGNAVHNSWSARSDSFQTPHYASMYWMPPADPAMIDLYAGQEAIPGTAWTQTYGASATEVNALFADSAAWANAHALGVIADVPRPPGESPEVIVKDRSERDEVRPNQSLWVVDSRMRANTDGDLDQWRYFGTGSNGGAVTAAPVVYRRRVTDGSTIEFEVVFVGEPQTAASGDETAPVLSGQTFAVQAGDYFGVVFTNSGAQTGAGVIPYTSDDWATLHRPDGSVWLRDGSVTYRVTGSAAPRVGQVLTFGPAAFRTYSFEFRFRL